MGPTQRSHQKEEFRLGFLRRGYRGFYWGFDDADKDSSEGCAEDAGEGFLGGWRGDGVERQGKAFFSLPQIS